MLKKLVKRADVTDKEVKELRKELKSNTSKMSKNRILPVIRVSTQYKALTVH